MASNNNEAQTTTTNAEEAISKGSNGSGSDTPVTYEMSSSSLLFDGNRSEGSECVIAANDSFSNNDDMGTTSEHRMEDSNSNNGNATIPLRLDMSSSSGFDMGVTEDSLSFI